MATITKISYTRLLRRLRGTIVVRRGCRGWGVWPNRKVVGSVVRRNRLEKLCWGKARNLQNWTNLYKIRKMRWCHSSRWTRVSPSPLATTTPATPTESSTIPHSKKQLMAAMISHHPLRRPWICRTACFWRMIPRSWGRWWWNPKTTAHVFTASTKRVSRLSRRWTNSWMRVGE